MLAVSCAGLTAAAHGQPRVDLIARSLTAPLVASPRDSVTAQVVVRSGSRPVLVGWMWAVVASTDARFSPEDVFLSSGVFTDGIPAATDVNFVAVLKVPATLALGSYTFMLVLDPANTLAEDNENNNVVAAPRTTIDLADLVTEQLLGDAPAVTPGQTITLTLRTRNAGGVPARAGWATGLVLSRDSVPSADDTPLGGVIETAVIAATASGITRSTSATIPATLSAGPHYVLAIADTGRLVQESREDNNVIVWPLFIVETNLGVVQTGGTRAVRGTLSATGDTDDYFRVQVQDPSNGSCFAETFEITTQLSQPSGQDFDVFLYSADGSVLIGSANGAQSGQSERLAYRLPGKCYAAELWGFIVRVRYRFGVSPSNYTLTIDFSRVSQTPED